MLQRIRNEYGGIKAFYQHLVCNFTSVLKILELKKITISPENRIVFVCKGNICRSPFAHWYMKNKVTNEIISFGLKTKASKPANDRILKLSKSCSVDLSNHLTSTVEAYDYRPNDILVCMELSQLYTLKKMFPKATVTVLSVYLKWPRLYLHDPYAASEIYAKNCLNMIMLSVDRWIKLSIK